ncbi:type II secretion system F family protein [Nanoarchaeota archaeon]
MPQTTDYQNLKNRYLRELEGSLGGSPKKAIIDYNKEKKKGKRVYSSDYQNFREEYRPPHHGWYEKGCQFAGKILKMKPDPKTEQKYQKAIANAHLDITPTGALSFAILFPLIILLGGVIITFILFTQAAIFFIFFMFIIALSLAMISMKLPMFLEKTSRMKSSSQMVLCIFYIVTYMRHTSNLELAINFAADHISPPLSLDLKKILWDTEAGKYESVIAAMRIYLEGWKKENLEFVESFQLIEGSLYETSEKRRVETLDKSLNVILDGTYEKMLHYAHNLSSPLMMLNMLGIVLPVLGLVILPLIVTFLSKNVEPTLIAIYIGALYIIVLPGVIYYSGMKTLSTRPGGSSNVDVTESSSEARELEKTKVKFLGQTITLNPIYIAAIIFIICIIIGLIPVLAKVGVSDIQGFIDNDPNFPFPPHKMYGYIGCEAGPSCTAGFVGPYGLGATLLSLFFPLAFGLAFGLYFKMRSKNVIKIRNETLKLESQFTSGLFQLGNRLSDGLPAEIAFRKAGETMQGTVSGKFFSEVYGNITRLGMSVENAIFDKKIGVVRRYPSSIIISSMKVLVESAKKGPRIAAQALLNISRYIKEIHQVNERLNDLLAEVIASMKSQIKFMAPLIAGIVVGITSMITTIITHLRSVEATEGAESAGQFVGLMGMGVPSYYFQLIVGIYIFQLIFILTVIVNGIESGSDKLQERYLLGQNLIRGTIMYIIISFAITIVFNMIAGSVLTGI